MALALKVLNGPAGGDNTQRRTTLYGTGTLTGTYPATAGGEPITWTSITSVDGATALVNTLTPTAPLFVQFQVGITNSATPSLTFIGQYNYSTGKLQIFTAPTAATENTPFEELAESFSYSATFTGATLYWKADFLSE